MACSYYDLQFSVESHNLQLNPGFDHVLNFKIAVQGSAQKAISSNINISTDTAHAVLSSGPREDRGRQSFQYQYIIFFNYVCVWGGYKVRRKHLIHH